MIDDRINDRLTSSGGKSLTHQSIGDVITGTVLAADYQQKKKFGTGELEFFADGKPMEQLVITLQTTLREEPEDDGIRRRFLKWEEEKALGALLQAKKLRLEVGGIFASKWTGDEPAKNGGKKKLYQVDYAAPVAQPAGSGLI